MKNTRTKYFLSTNSLLLILLLHIGCSEKKSLSSETDGDTTTSVLTEESIVEEETDTPVLPLEELKMTEFEKKKFFISLPEGWQVNKEEMNNAQSPAHFTALIKLSEKNSVTFQIINLLAGDNQLEGSVKKFCEESVKQNPELKPLTIDSKEAVQAVFRFGSDVRSQSYFIKNGKDLFWLQFMGREMFIYSQQREIEAIANSFRIK